MKSKVIMASGREYIVAVDPKDLVRVPRLKPMLYEAQELPPIGAPLDSEEIWFNLGQVNTIQAYEA